MHGGAELDGSVLKLIGQAGFTDLSLAVETLSGGWRKRLSLVSGLSQPAEVYFLDEPTNHLDVEGIWWLEDVIKSHSAAFVICTHDRFFLQSVARRMLEINPVFEGGFFIADGSYRQFLEKRSIHLEAEAKRQDRLQNVLRREREWLSRQPKARGTKAKARIDAAMALTDELQEVTARLTTTDTSISFSGTGKKSRRLIEVEHVRKSFDERVVLSDVSFVVTPGSKIALLGVNGSGKSTLLKLLAGMLTQDAGRVHRVQGLSVAYFDQERSLLDDQQTLRRTFAPDSDSVVFGNDSIHVTSWARRFGFEHDDLDKPLHMFSGGEKARAYIGCLVLQEADVLLLDEPTNDLDIETLEMLEAAFKGSGRTLVIVSHDRFFLSEVCTEFLAVDPGGVVNRYGDVEQWQRRKRKQADAAGKEESVVAGAADPAKAKKRPGRLSYNEQREYASIEADIEAAEGEVARLEGELAMPEHAANADTLNSLSAALAEATGRVEHLYTRWTELEEKLSGG
jgi:ATP-binding cassette subfamily F protein uup